MEIHTFASIIIEITSIGKRSLVLKSRAFDQIGCNLLPSCRIGIVHRFFPTYLTTRFPPVRPFLPSHFCTDWLSWLGLGNQVGSTTDHLINCYLPSSPKDRSTMSLNWVIYKLWSSCAKHKRQRLEKQPAADVLPWQGWKHWNSLGP